jgi:hypothetical protein
MAERSRQALKSATTGKTDADFLSSLYRALVSSILGRRKVIGTSLTWSEAKTYLIDIGWEPDEADTTVQLLEEIESFNYSGVTLDQDRRADLLKRTRREVRRLAQ